jgi:hypothetical protein
VSQTMHIDTTACVNEGADLRSQSTPTEWMRIKAPSLSPQP